MSLLRAWLQFCRERFSPLAHLPLVAAFVASHVVLIHATSRRLIAATAVYVLLFFFRLRIFDELKDHETDAFLHPERPLPRGLLSPRHLRLAFVLGLLCELGLVLLVAPRAILPATLATAYSLLMYREFFLGRWLRPRLTTYAVTHTLVIVLLSLTTSALLTARLPWDLPPSCLPYAVGCWGLFNVFELSRKTFARSEERPYVSSYSKVWSRPGAVAFAVSQAAGSGLLMGWASRPAVLGQLWLMSAVTLLLGAGLLLLAHDSAAGGRLYRVAGRLAIVVQLLWFVPQLLVH